MQEKEPKLYSIEQQLLAERGYAVNFTKSSEESPLYEQFPDGTVIVRSHKAFGIQDGVTVPMTTSIQFDPHRIDVIVHRDLQFNEWVKTMQKLIHENYSLLPAGLQTVMAFKHKADPQQ
jgi:hypothetical protein